MGRYLRLYGECRLSAAQYVLGLDSDDVCLGRYCHRAQPGRPMKNILRELRTERGWSQADLADRLEVSRQTINAIETGRYDPSLPLAFKISRQFKLKIEDIFVANKH